MNNRLSFGEGGEFTVPRELLGGRALEEGTILSVRLDEEGNAVLRPIAPVPARDYSESDLEVFAAEDEVTPDFEARLDALFERAPRLPRG